MSKWENVTDACKLRLVSYCKQNFVFVENDQFYFVSLFELF